VVVSNSNQQMGGAGGGDPWTANPTWQNTFDAGLSMQMSIAFWAKGFPDVGNPWVAKKGTDFGYQVARSGSNNFATFTQTGTPGADSPAGTMLNVNDIQPRLNKGTYSLKEWIQVSLDLAGVPRDPVQGAFQAGRKFRLGHIVPVVRSLHPHIVPKRFDRIKFGAVLRQGAEVEAVAVAG
jgi:hypothetical protein